MTATADNAQTSAAQTDQIDSEQLVLREDTDGVAVLSFNRPDRANAYSVPMEAEYYRQLQACEQDPDVRVIVVTGAGRTFCPGMDSGALSAQANDKAASTFPHKRTSITYPRSIRKPIIAAINGACAGIGVIIAMNCDLRFTTTRAKITTSFSHRGIMAEHGLAWILPRTIGPSRALDLLLSSRIILGEEALRLGLVDRVFEPETFMDETLEYARNLARLSSPVAMGIIKQQVYDALDSTQEEARVAAIRWWYDTFKEGPDFREGINSYLEKREPDFAPWDPGTNRAPAQLPLD
jgi:enoyl-CoA hydratase/carnithine racemase